ncbi:hypothetical protein, partial [Paenibacillus cymbidii]|uniref:hypothetical protein n=1 Tax=Paenibacillus cymbidii TaxID=1639034 RepID=UPI0038B25C91
FGSPAAAAAAPAGQMALAMPAQRELLAAAGLAAWPGAGASPAPGDGSPPAALAPPELAHKQLAQAEASAAADTAASMELLRPKRAEQETAAGASEDVAPEDLDWTPEQISRLAQRLPQLDVNRIADKVYREIEKRIKFEQQRRGL